METVGVDVGGTKVASGLVSADGAVQAVIRHDTPAEDGDAILAVIVDSVRELSQGRRLPVGVGAPGLVDLEGVVRYAPNVDWKAYPLRRRLAESLGVDVRVDNDANAAAWGEYRVGAGRQAGRSMVMLTVGTGIGGGVVSEDRLLRGANGLGAELGHIIVNEAGPPCPCGNRGCLEALASGTAIGRAAQSALAAGTVPAASALRGLAEVTGRSVAGAARDGDEAAAEIMRTAGSWLGVGIASLVNALDPETVVLGGGAMTAGDLLLPPAQAAFSARLIGRGYREPPTLAAAQLGADAGLIGAALLAHDC